MIHHLNIIKIIKKDNNNNKKACERCQNLPKEEKKKKQQYSHKQYENLADYQKMINKSLLSIEKNIIK